MIAEYCQIVSFMAIHTILNGILQHSSVYAAVVGQVPHAKRILMNVVFSLILVFMAQPASINLEIMNVFVTSSGLGKIVSNLCQILHYFIWLDKQPTMLNFKVQYYLL